MHLLLNHLLAIPAGLVVPKGYVLERHEVTTSDGYVIVNFRCHAKSVMRVAAHVGRRPALLEASPPRQLNLRCNHSCILRRMPEWLLAGLRPVKY